MVVSTTPDIVLDPVTEGMVSDGVLSQYVAPASSMSYLENFHNDTVGVLTARPPLARCDFDPSTTVSSAVFYVDSAGSPWVVWQEGTNLKYRAGLSTGVSTSTYSTSASSAGKSRYDTVLGNLIITQGSGTEPKYTTLAASPASLGTSFGTVDLISAGFIGRIWCALSTAANNRVYYSDVIPAAGLASLTGGSSYLTINANGTDKITGFARTQNCLFVFTDNGIFRVFNTQSQDNTPIINVGTPSQESIVKTKDGFYFFHSTGVYKLAADGSVVEVSTRIRDVIEKIRPSSIKNTIGWADKDHVYFSVGANIQDYETTKTWVLRYTVSTQVWTIYSFYDFVPTAIASSFVPGQTTNVDNFLPFPITYIFGTNIAANSYYASTFGSPTYTGSNPWTNVNGDLNLNKIYLKAITQWKNFGIESHFKRVTGVSQAHENGAGLTLDYIKDKDNKSVFQQLMPLTQNYVDLNRDVQSDEFNRIKFRIEGESIGAPIVVGQTTVLKLDNMGYRNG